MSELTGVEQLGLKNPLNHIVSKAQISVELPSAQNLSNLEKTQEKNLIDIEMKEADQAFAMMMDIHQRLQKIYEGLSPPEGR